MISLTNDDKYLIKNNAAIIDDEIYTAKSSAQSIANVLSEYGTTFVKEESLPEKDKWDNFLSMSYIILDWDLKREEKDELPEGVQIGATFVNETRKNSMDFIKHIISKSLVPIFIITQEDTNYIKQTLNQEPQIKEAMSKSNVIIEKKQDVKGDKIINFLQEWINSNNNIKVLKRLEKNINETKNMLFVDMDSIEKDWIDIVKDTIDKDEPEDSILELSQFITNMFLSRLPSIDFTEINFNKDKAISKTNLIKIYSATKVYTNDKADVGAQHTGDIYVQEKGQKRLYINVTAECDARKSIMFLVKCSKRSKKDINLDSNTIIDHADRFTIPMMLDREAVVCKLDCIERIDKTDNLNEIDIAGNKFIRAGRLTHPYITALRKKIAEYFSRQGLPVHPMDRI